MAYSVLGTFPEFVPACCDTVDESSQRTMYEFLWSVIRKIYYNPALLDLLTEPDDAFEMLEGNNHKPELIKSMKTDLTKIQNFYGLLLKLGETGSVINGALHIDHAALKLQPKKLAQLEAFGLCCENRADGLTLSCTLPDGFFPAWKLLSQRVLLFSDPVAAFARAMFSSEYPYGTEIYAFLSGNKRLFNALEQFMRENGYARKESVQECGSRIEYRKDYSPKDEGGINIWYDYRKRNSIFFELKIPRFRELLGRFDAMEVLMKDLVIERTKKCDGCGYCVQLDRERRKRMMLPVQHEGREHAVCPLFPYLTWHYISERSIDEMQKLLLFAESELKAKQAI